MGDSIFIESPVGTRAPASPEHVPGRHAGIHEGKRLGYRLPVKLFLPGIRPVGAAGRRVRDIGSALRLPAVMIWDGNDNAGVRVTPGFYIVACELTPSSAVGETRVEKVVVGCARKSTR